MRDCEGVGSTHRRARSAPSGAPSRAGRARGRGADGGSPTPLPARWRRILGLWAAAALLSAGRALWRGLAAPPAVTTAQPRWIDVNRASVDELQVLPGVGPGRAEAIVLERIRRGPFAAFEDLARVEGLGPGTLQRLRPFVRAGAPDHVVTARMRPGTLSGSLPADDQRQRSPN